MISEKLLNALNEQVNYELYSAYTYLAMSAYAESIDFSGIANFFKVQAQEEVSHAMKLYDFIFQKGGTVVLDKIDKPEPMYEGVVNLFEVGYHHEQIVTQKIYNLADIASEEKEHATLSLLKWFIDEQVEEEDSFSTLLKRAKRSESNSAAIYIMDDELATRVYAPPAPNA